MIHGFLNDSCAQRSTAVRQHSEQKIAGGMSPCIHRGIKPWLEQLLYWYVRDFFKNNEELVRYEQA